MQRSNAQKNEEPTVLLIDYITRWTRNADDSILLLRDDGDPLGKWGFNNW